MLIIIIVFTGCRKPYNPAIINVSNNYLVVETVINSDFDLCAFLLPVAVGPPGIPQRAQMYIQVFGK
jgi:hypothetical protein